MHDAGWSTLVRLIVEKADAVRPDRREGRPLVPVVAAVLGVRAPRRPKPLTVRAWTCPCGADHDRDLNAARNVLAEGRRIAAGLAEIKTPVELVSAGLCLAVGDEAGTRLARLA